ncbi:MAG: hypothetical protein ACXACR_15745, partial [Candidatus Hodarchaeales archaeon]
IDFSPKALGAGNFYEIQAPDEKKYLLFDVDSPDIIAYEIIPRVKNLITLINKLFGLKLFKETIEEVLLKKDFNAEYIDDVFKRIGFPNISYDVRKIDSLDGKEKIIIVVKKGKSEIKIEITDGHAKAEVDNEKRKHDLDTGIQLANFFDRKGLVSLNDFLLLALNKSSINEIFERDWIKQIPADIFEKLVLFIDLDTADKKTEAAKKILLFKKINEKQKKIIEYIWIKIINTLPILDGQTHREIIEELLSIDSFVEMITSKSNFAENKNSESYLLILSLYALRHLKEEVEKAGAFRDILIRFKQITNKILENLNLLEELIKSENLVLLDNLKEMIQHLLPLRDKSTKKFFTKIEERFFKENLVKVKSSEVESKIVLPFSVFTYLPVEKATEFIHQHFNEILKKIVEAYDITNEKDRVKVVAAGLDSMYHFAKNNLLTPEEMGSFLDFLGKNYSRPEIEIKRKALDLLSDLIEEEKIDKKDERGIKLALDLLFSAIKTSNEHFWLVSLSILKKLVFAYKIEYKENVKNFLKIAAENVIAKKATLRVFPSRLPWFVVDLIKKNKFTIEDFLTDEFTKIGSLNWIALLDMEKSDLEKIFNFIFFSDYEKAKRLEGVFNIIKGKFFYMPSEDAKTLVRKNSQRVFDFIMKVEVSGSQRIPSLKSLLRDYKDYDLKKTKENVDAVIKFVVDMSVNFVRGIMFFSIVLINEEWLTSKNVGPIFVKILEEIYKYTYDVTGSEKLLRRFNIFLKRLIKKDIVNKDNIVSLSESLDEKIREKLPELISKVGLEPEQAKALQDPLEKKQQE